MAANVGILDGVLSEMNDRHVQPKSGCSETRKRSHESARGRPWLQRAVLVPKLTGKLNGVASEYEDRWYLEAGNTTLRPIKSLEKEFNLIRDNRFNATHYVALDFTAGISRKVFEKVKFIIIPDE